MNYKKDNLVFGLVLGLCLPMVVYGILFLVLQMFNYEYVLKRSTMELTAIVLAVPVFRYYMVNLKAEKTGQGMMLVIFGYAMFFVIRHFGMFQ